MSHAFLQGRDATLLDLLDRVLDKGAVIDGKVLLSVADIDLVYLGIKVVLASVERLESPGPWQDLKGPLELGAPPEDPDIRAPDKTFSPSILSPGSTEVRKIGSLPRFPASALESQGGEGKPACPQAKVKGEGSPINPQKVEQGLARLVLTLVELLRRLMEKQAIRRMEGGSLTPKEMEGLGLVFKRLEERMEDLKRVFGLEGEELNLNLGPLGNLM